jgi:hypothetical protein
MERIAAVALVAVASVAALPMTAPAATKVLRVTTEGQLRDEAGWIGKSQERHGHKQQL